MWFIENKFDQIIILKVLNNRKDYNDLGIKTIIIFNLEIIIMINRNIKI